jgi:hypothetical protein
LLEFPFIPSSELGLFNGLALLSFGKSFVARFSAISQDMTATKSAAPWHDRPSSNAFLKIKSHNRTFGKKVNFPEAPAIWVD